MPRRTTRKPKPTSSGPQLDDLPDAQTPEPQSAEIKRAAVVPPTGSKPKQKKRKADLEEDSSADDEPPSQKKKSRKRIALDMSPLAPRNRRMKMLVGAHVSVAKGLSETSSKLL